MCRPGGSAPANVLYGQFSLLADCKPEGPKVFRRALPRKPQKRARICSTPRWTSIAPSLTQPGFLAVAHPSLFAQDPQRVRRASLEQENSRASGESTHTAVSIVTGCNDYFPGGTCTRWTATPFVTAHDMIHNPERDKSQIRGLPRLSTLRLCDSARASTPAPYQRPRRRHLPCHARHEASSAAEQSSTTPQPSI